MKMFINLARLIVASLTVLSFNTSKAQTVDCTSAKTGTFELVSPVSGRTVIYRTVNTQTEKNDSAAYEATFDLVWVDSCIYELRNKKLIKGDTKLVGKPTDILRVEILKIEGKKIFVRSSSNYSDLVLERILTKIE